MGHLDQAARYSAKQHDAAAHQTWLLPQLTAAWRFARWLDTRTLPFPGEPDRTCDTVAEWHRRTGDHPPIAVVQEYRVEPRQEAFEQVARYIQDVRREIPFQAGVPLVRYEVLGVLIFLTGPPQPDTWEMRPPDCGGLGQTITFGVRCLSVESAAATLAAIGRGEVGRCVLPWVPLTEGGAEPAVLEEWKRLAVEEPEAWKRADYAALAKVFAEAADRKFVWEQALEGFNVQESLVIKEWEARGRAEAVRANTAAVLRRHFGLSELPADLGQQLAAERDPEKLQRWFDLALQVESLEAFRAGLVNGQT